MTARRAAIAAFVAIGLAAPNAARAHDLIEVVNIAAEDDQGHPLVLLTTLGLVARTAVGEPWHYVCPSLHGGPEAPPATSAGRDRIWLVTLDGAQLVTGAIEPVTEKLPALKAHMAPKLVTNGNAAVALTEQKRKTSLLRLHEDGPQTIHTTSWTWSNVAPLGDGFLLASVDWEADATFANVAPDGTVTATRSAPAQGFEVQLYPATEDVVLASVPDAAGAGRLVRITSDDAEVVLETTVAITGAAIVGGKTFVLLDRTLHEQDGDRTNPTGEPQTIAHLHTGRRASYASYLLWFWTLNEDGTIGETVLDPTALAAPVVPASLDADTAETCRLEWEGLRFELGLDDVEPVPPADPTPLPSGGCVTTGTPNTPAWLALGLVLLAIRRRRRVLSAHMI